MEVQKPLFPLLRDLPGVDQVVARGDELPAFDLHCPMLGMPLALETTLATIRPRLPICTPTRVGSRLGGRGSARCRNRVRGWGWRGRATPRTLQTAAGHWRRT